MQANNEEGDNNDIMKGFGKGIVPLNTKKKEEGTENNLKTQ